MSSRFINFDDFDKFEKKLVNQKAPEPKSFAPKWDTKTMKGTAENPNTYEFRYLPEASKSFYKSYFYHMKSINDKWNYMICPKTFDAEAYCPICAAVQKLYKGTSDDKLLAKDWKRKQRYAANVLIIDDPRDASQNDVEKKVVGKVLMFEFPGEIEKVLRGEIEDKKRGIGYLTFDPGDEGYNFVLKVGAKPGDKPGSTWPTYTLQLAKRPCAIADNDVEIQALLDKTYNLDDYLNASVVTEEHMIKLMKEGLIYDFIKFDYERRSAPTESPTAAPSMDTFEKKLDAAYEKTKDEPKKAAPKAESAKKVAGDAPEMSKDDADLLAELAGMN